MGDYVAPVSAVGCSDLVPPSDAWLKRSDNVATVGCYMTRQTWILTCDLTGRWTGTFGNCTQRTAVSDNFDVCYFSKLIGYHLNILISR